MRLSRRGFFKLGGSAIGAAALSTVIDPPKLFSTPFIPVDNLEMGAPRALLTDTSGYISRDPYQFSIIQMQSRQNLAFAGRILTEDEILRLDAPTAKRWIENNIAKPAPGTYDIVKVPTFVYQPAPAPFNPHATDEMVLASMMNRPFIPNRVNEEIIASISNPNEVMRRMLDESRRRRITTEAPLV